MLRCSVWVTVSFWGGWEGVGIGWVLETRPRHCYDEWQVNLTPCSHQLPFLCDWILAESCEDPAHQ